MNTQSDRPHGRLVEIAGTFLKLGALSYGGPAIMGIMQSEIQEKRRFRNVLWIKAAMKGTTPAVVGVLAVSLFKLVPHAAPDAFTLLLLTLTVAAMTLWRLAPLTLIAAGAVAGIAARLKPLQRLKDLG